MRPETTVYRTPVRHSAPQAIGMARVLGWLYGKAIAGDNGRIRIGYPALGLRNKYTGYVYPPQLFTGYDPRKVAAGFIRPDPATLPGESMNPGGLSSPLQKAMASVMTSQMAAQ